MTGAQSTAVVELDGFESLVAGGNYCLLSFMEVWSRYIVHHQLLRCMRGLGVSIEAAVPVV